LLLSRWTRYLIPCWRRPASGSPTTAPPQERIASIDDHVLFKVKVQRWRGAVWVADDIIPWLVAAGQREDGSPDDFYAALATRGKAARSQYNAAHTPPLTTDTHTDDLLPAAEDELRWKAEHAVRMERRLRVTVHSLLREASRGRAGRKPRSITPCL
jgi:hypothetical protein